MSTLLPCGRLSNSLRYLDFGENKIESFNITFLKNLEELYFDDNQIEYFNNQLPNSLKILDCSKNKIKNLKDISLINSTLLFNCSDNKLSLLPKFKNKIKLYFNQDESIEYIPYTKNII